MGTDSVAIEFLSYAAVTMITKYLLLIFTQNREFLYYIKDSTLRFVLNVMINRQSTPFTTVMNPLIKKQHEVNY